MRHQAEDSTQFRCTQTMLPHTQVDVTMLEKMVCCSDDPRGCCCNWMAWMDR